MLNADSCVDMNYIFFLMCEDVWPKKTDEIWILIYFWTTQKGEKIILQNKLKHTILQDIFLALIRQTTILTNL